MSGIVNTGSFPKRLWPGVLAWFGDEYNRYDMEYKEIFETKKSDKAYEDLTGLVGMGLAVIKDQGGSVEYAAPKQGYTSRFVNINYGKGFIITQEMQDDDQYAASIAEIGAKQLAFSMIQTKETIGANVLNNGFTGGAFVGGDGVALLSTAHPLMGGSGATSSNKLSVDADFSEAALEQALIDIAGIVDDANMKLKLMPEKLIIPRQVEFDARRVLMSDYRVATADNDINASKGFLPGGYCVNHFLSDSDAWFIRTNCPVSMLHLERSPFALTSDDDFDTSNAKFKVMERYSFGWADWRGIFGSSGAG